MFFVVVGLGLLAVFFVLLMGKPSADVPEGWPRNIEQNVVGQWAGESSDFVIIFGADGEYQILNYKGNTILGDWEVTQDGQIKVPVSYRDYDGVWYFEPATKGTMTLEVEDLDISDTFYKVEQ